MCLHLGLMNVLPYIHRHVGPLLPAPKLITLLHAVMRAHSLFGMTMTQDINDP